MKKVLFFMTDVTGGGGVQRVTSIIANNLDEEYDITILSLFSKNENSPYLWNKGITMETLFKNQFDLRLNALKVLKYLRKFFKNNDDFDVVIADGIGLSSFLYISTLRFKFVKIAWEHQSFYFGKKFGLEWIGKQIAGKYFDFIITLTKRDQAYYLKQNFNAEVIQIYNPLVNKSVKIADYSSKKIISVGSLIDQKGFDYAIDIAKIIFKDYSDWQWDIWGTGKRHDYLQELIKENNLENHIFLRGFNSNIYSEYGNYSIYAMTSRHEGFPMVLLEAKSVGLPIVSFDIDCGPSEIIFNDINGYLIENMNIFEYSKKLTKLMEEENRRKEFSKNMLKENKEFSLDFIISKWKKILK